MGIYPYEVWQFILFLLGALTVVIGSGIQGNKKKLSLILIIVGVEVMNFVAIDLREDGQNEIAEKLLCSKFELGLPNANCEKDGWRVIRKDGEVIKIIYPKGWDRKKD